MWNLQIHKAVLSALKLLFCLFIIKTRSALFYISLIFCRNNRFMVLYGFSIARHVTLVSSDVKCEEWN